MKKGKFGGDPLLQTPKLAIGGGFYDYFCQTPLFEGAK